MTTQRLSDEAHRWRIAHGLPPEPELPVVSVANPFAQYLARPQAATEPITRVAKEVGLTPDEEAQARAQRGVFGPAKEPKDLTIPIPGTPGVKLSTLRNAFAAFTTPPSPEELYRQSGVSTKSGLPNIQDVLMGLSIGPAVAPIGRTLEAGYAGAKVGQVARAIPGAAKSYVQAAARGPAAQAVVPVKQAVTEARKALKSEPFFVQTRSGWKSVEGRPVTFQSWPGEQFFVHRDIGAKTWVVSEARTGTAVVTGELTSAKAIEAARTKMAGMAQEQYRGTYLSAKEGFLKQYGESPRFVEQSSQALAAGQAEMPVAATLRKGEEFLVGDSNRGISVAPHPSAKGRWLAYAWRDGKNAPATDAYATKDAAAAFAKKRIVEGDWQQKVDTFMADAAAKGIVTPSVAKAPATAVPARGGAKEAVAPTTAEAARVTEPVIQPAAVVPPSAARPVGPSVTSQAAPLTADQRIEAQIAAVRAQRAGGAGVPPVEPPTALGGAPPVPEEPEAKLVRLLKETKPVRKETEILKHKEMQVRAARVAAMMEGKTGQEALFGSLGQLKGELPQAAFEPPATLGFTKAEADVLLDKIRTHPLPPLSKVTPMQALNSLIFEGRLPTKGELTTMEQIFGADLIKALRDKRGLGEKIWDASMDTIGLPKALVASADISAPMRQGLPLLTDPSGSWFKAWAPMLRAFAKDKWAIQAHEAIQANPLFQKALEAGVDFTMFGAKGLKLTTHEERFMSRFTARIPWVRMSERAYVTFLNKLRMDTFAYYARQLASQDAGPERYKAMAQFVNWATGRGTIPLRGERAAAVLNATFFAPRFVASRLELPATLISRDPLVRKVAWRNMAGTVGVGLTTLGLMKLAGAEVELDPRSTDFGKGRFGGTRFDFWGGFQQYARYMTQLITAQRKTARGEITDAQRRDIAVRFLESKEGPIAGLITAMLEGKTFTGVKVAPTKEFAQQQLAAFFVPMVVQDMYDAAKEHGLIGLAVGAPSSTGVGVLTYESLSSNWRKDLAEFDAIPTNDNEREAKGIKVTRIQYRERHPDVDAKLFILGEVTSLQTSSAVIKAALLIRENQVDVGRIRGVQERAEKTKERQGLGLSPEMDKTKVGLLLRMLEAGQPQSSSPSGVPSQPTPASAPTTSTGGLSDEAKAWRVAHGRTAEAVGAR